MKPASPPRGTAARGALRYARWLDGHRVGVLIAALVVALGAGALTARLQLKSDFAHLLPPTEKSVRDLQALQKRANAFGTVFALIESSDPAVRAQAALALDKRLRTDLPSDLVAHVTFDDGAARRYFWENRFLFVDLTELEEADRALSDKVRRAKLEANPLWIDLDDEPDPNASTDPNAPDDLDDRVVALRKKLDDAESKAKAPARFVSKDETLQFIIVRTTFSGSDATKAKRLVTGVRRAMDETAAEISKASGGDTGRLRFAITGTVPNSLYEHQSVLRGMLLAAIITVALCALALLLYYGSLMAVMTSLWSLTVGTLVTFAFTWLTIGHLNLMSAFLTAIVVGNGINTGLIFMSRYFEELRADASDEQALAAAIGGTLRGTLAAALTAGVAYGSLLITDFRGFRHFGLIAGVGMFMCWGAAFTVLPAGLAMLKRRGWIRVRPKAPRVGRILARLLPRNIRAVVFAIAAITVVAGAVTWRYLASDPFLKDWRHLRSDSADMRTARAWDKRMADEFDRGFTKGLASQFAIGLDSRKGVRDLTAQLRARDKDLPPDEQLLSQVHSIDDLLPTEQQRKLELLAHIRKLVKDDVVSDLSDKDRATIERITPPESVQALTMAQIPSALAWPFTEKDGTRGRLILARSAPRFKTWNVADRVEFANGVRALKLPPEAVIGGQSFVIADIITSMERDGPRAIALALIGSVLAVWLIMGLRKHGMVTLACAAAGIVIMVALCAAWGLEIHFLDLIALPITIGIGADYAVNLTARERQSEGMDPRRLLATTGGAVLLCSFTTTVGYGSLLLSENGGIRSFGLAAILGEIACVLSALALAPSLLRLLRRRH